MSEDEQRGARASRSVRSVGHAASGGHSLIRNRTTHEPNALPVQEHKAHHPVKHNEYPKRLYIDGKSVRVLDAEEEGAALAPSAASADEPKRRGRPPKIVAAASE